MANLMICRLGLVLGLACGVASAQVAPPPPAEAEPQPVYTPPAAQPEAPKPAAQPARNNATKLQELPTNIPYPKLAQIGEDGKVIRLKDLPEVLALRANPTIGDQSVDEIMPVMHGRRARFEMLVIENLDLYWALSAGEIDNLNMSDLKEMSRVAEMIKPLVGKTTLSEELMNRGILTRVQGGMNEHIVREYKQAISDEIQAQEGQDGLAEFMRFILHDSIQEVGLAYLGMMAEGKEKAAVVIEKTGVKNDAVAALAGELSADVTEAEAQIYAFDAAFRTLSLDDAVKFLTALRETRENPNMSPTIKRVVVTHDRKVNYEGDGMKFKVTEGKDLPLDSRNQKAARDAAKAKEAGETPAEQPAAEEPAQDQPTPAALAPLGTLIDTGC